MGRGAREPRKRTPGTNPTMKIPAESRAKGKESHCGRSTTRTAARIHSAAPKTVWARRDNGTVNDKDGFKDTKTRIFQMRSWAVAMVTIYGPRSHANIATAGLQPDALCESVREPEGYRHVDGAAHGDAGPLGGNEAPRPHGF